MKFQTDLKEKDVTSEEIFKDRRNILKGLGFVGASLLLSQVPVKAESLSDELTPENKITGYNNFYEFGWDKSDPARYQNRFKSDPWQVVIDGEVNAPITLDLDDLNKIAQEERIYRFRCVEAWSMVIPWLGFPLSALLKLADPTSEARYVAFETLYDPAQFPNQGGGSFGGFSFPYVEGLTIEEAMHPLTFMSMGLYGKKLLPQNGAPLRLVVPWKYGFKSIKSIVKITLTKHQPRTTWNMSAPHEYGFYANVNPNVSHPRWSQASERIIGTEGLFGAKRRNTELFNGYSEVASLYTGMDLKKNY